MNWSRWFRNSCIAAVLLAAPAAAQTVARIGVVSLPPERANPFASVVVPGLLTNILLYDALFVFDKNGEVQPGLALSSEMTSPTTWRLRLRENVTFSNGEPFDAAAAASALNYLVNEAGALEVIAQIVDDVVTARAVGRYTLEIVTEAPNVLLPRRLTGVRIPAPKAWAELGRERFGGAPVGTGLFTMTSRAPNKAVFSANATGWRKPALDRIELLVIPDRTARVQALRTGAIDLAADINPEDRSTVEEIGGTFLVRPTGRVQTVTFMSLKDHPVADVRVRRALNYAVDKQRIVDVLLGGTTVPTAQPASRQGFGYVADIAPYPYDPDRARAMLAEAGHAKGFDLTMTYPSGAMAGDDAFYQQIALDLSKVGVRMTIEGSTYAQHLTRIRTGGWPGEAFGMDFNNMPVLDALWSMRVHSCMFAAPWHCREDWVPLIKAAETATTVEDRRKRTEELARLYHNDPTGIFLWDMPGLDGAGPRLTNVETGLGFLDFVKLDVK